MTRKRLLAGLLPALFIPAALSLTACGGSDAPTHAGGDGRGSAAAVPLTGDTIQVQMISGRGELFEPADITARRGDVIRFVLVMGVHNASFPPDKNPPGVKLPETSPYLQIPGQTHDLIVDLPPGEYFFQCDPHAILGMVGTLTVRE